VPEGPDELPELERQRAELYRELSQVGDFRPGSLNKARRAGPRPGMPAARPTFRVSQEAAEAAFTLAVSLVTLFSSGAVTRRPVP